MMLTQRLVVGALTATLAASCSSTPEGTDPHDMSAEGHRDHAQAEDNEASAHVAKFEPTAEAELVTADPDNTFAYNITTYNPTGHHLREAAAHRVHASAHRDAAAALERFEQDECAKFPPKTRSACPLLGQVARAENVEDGVRVTPAEGVDRPAMLAHMRCHLAYAATHGFEGMDACPLYVKGVSVVDDGGTILIEAEERSEITAIQNGTATHVNPK